MRDDYNDVDNEEDEGDCDGGNVDDNKERERERGGREKERERGRRTNSVRQRTHRADTAMVKLTGQCVNEWVDG